MPSQPRGIHISSFLPKYCVNAIAPQNEKLVSFFLSCNLHVFLESIFAESLYFLLAEKPLFHSTPDNYREEA